MSDTQQGERRPSGLDFVPYLPPLHAILLLAGCSLLLFLFNLQHPLEMMFDETHYVPAGRELFFGRDYLTVDHPPLGKWLIGLSMAIFDDTPWGWRVLSTLMGSVTIVAVFLIAQSLFRDARLSFTAALLALLSEFVFILARIAMLDIYMGAFLLLALWLVIDGYDKDRNRLRLAGAGILFGLAVGCKWPAVPYVAATILCFLTLRLWAEPNLRPFLLSRDIGAWRGVSTIEALACLGLLSVAVYLATYIPAFFLERNRVAPLDLVNWHLEMFRMHSAFYTHTYQSHWWQWPWIGRPIWFLYEKVEGVQRGVLMAGNPAVLWGGLVAVAACVVGGIARRRPRLLLIAGLWLFSYGIWAVIPRKLNFHYYYYMPVIFLSLALAAAFHFLCRGRVSRWVPALFLVVASAVFVYQYPIISALPLDRDDAFLSYTWFDSWR